MRRLSLVKVEKHMESFKERHQKRLANREIRKVKMLEYNKNWLKERPFGKL